MPQQGTRVNQQAANEQQGGSAGEAAGGSWRERVRREVGGQADYDQQLARLDPTADANAAPTRREPQPEDGGAAPSGAPSLGPRRTVAPLELRSAAGGGELVTMVPAGEAVEVFDDRRPVGAASWIAATFGEQGGWLDTSRLANFASLGRRRAQSKLTVRASAGESGRAVATLEPHEEAEALELRKVEGGATWIVLRLASGAWGWAPANQLGYPQRMATGQLALRPEANPGARTQVYVPKGKTLETCSAKVEVDGTTFIQVRYALDERGEQTLTGWVDTAELTADFTLLPSRYREMYEQAALNQEGKVDREELSATADLVNSHRSRYLAVSAQTGLPWYVIGVIHMREASFDFSTYLHQGDPLGRPPTHWPTEIPTFYEWEDAAVHAINQEREKFTDGLLEGLEGYNGTGYRGHDVNTPYLWSGTDQYEQGKYVADGRFSATAVDGQCGTAAVLKMMEEKGYIQIDRSML